MSDQPPILVQCQSAVDRLRPGNVTGYGCHFCGAALQISPRGLGQLAREGAVPACNRCGRVALAAFQKEGAEVNVQLNPSAVQQLRERFGTPAGEPLRYQLGSKQPIVIDHRGATRVPERPLTVQCDFCGASYDRMWCWTVRPCGVFFYAGALPVRYVYEGGDWRACVQCRPMVERRDWRLLEARARVMDPQGQALPQGYHRKLWTAIFSDLEDGKPGFWSAGQPLKARHAS